MSDTAAKPRDYSIDILKAIAIFGVITIHVCTVGYEFPLGSFNWVVSVFYGSLARASVPIFLMCSGALMLDPNRKFSFRRLFTHHLPRIIVAMLVWGFLYKLYHLLVSGAGFSVDALWQALKELLVFNQEFHFYYLHIIILVYLLLPITRVFVEHASKSMLQYALALWFLLGIFLPIAQKFWPLTLAPALMQKYVITIAYSAVGYGLAGHYIKRFGLNRRISVLCFLGGFAFVFFGTWHMSVQSGKLYALFFEGMSPAVCLMAVGLFGFFTARPLPEKLSKAALKISKASFCVYLSHVFFIYLFRNLGLSVRLLPCVVSTPLMTLGIFVCSYLVYALLSRIPLAREYLV